MKTALLSLITTFAASFALLQANAETAAPKSEPKTYLVQVDGATVAILPANTTRTICISCSGNATYDKATGVSIYSGDVKLVSDVPGQASITVTGEHLTLSPQK